MNSVVYANKLDTIDTLEGKFQRVNAGLPQQLQMKVIEYWASRLEVIQAKLDDGLLHVNHF